MLDTAQSWLIQQGLSDTMARGTVHVVLCLGVAILAWIVDAVARRLLLRSVVGLAKHSKTDWDDTLVGQGVFRHLAHLAPAIIVQLLAPLALFDLPRVVDLVLRGTQIYMLVVGAMVVNATLNAMLIIYRQYPIAQRFPAKTVLDFVKIIAFFIIAVIVLSKVLGQSPIAFLSGLGALTAVLMLIFKDSILGLVAGIQISANNLVMVGDWISMPRYDADGDVIDVSLTTVKVQNWDKTISSIPSYALVSESFKNWRGMSESGGRRIKRSIAIDMTTVRIADTDTIERWRRFSLLNDYIDRKLDEIAAWNAERGFGDDDEIINGRRLTNLGTFRHYVEAYLRAHPEVHPDLTFLVRQLPPTERGIPIEIYVFSKDQRWANYEDIQADIFDHLIAVIPEFGLRVFQLPTGADVASGLRAASNAAIAAGATGASGDSGDS